MAFNSAFFIFMFGPTVLILAYLAPSRIANTIILAASIAFYGWGEPRFLFAVLASAVVDYLLGFLIARGGTRGRWALAVGVCANISLLIYCKYSAFFVDTLGRMLGRLDWPLPEILLPLGLSFIVFEKITYLVDIHRKATPPARQLTDYLFFVFFFPKMLAGPIIKYHEIRDQIETRKANLDDVYHGLSRFLVGLAKKVLIADSLASVVETIFSAPTSQVGFGDAWLATLCFTVQIYFDFSGYSDMAIGLARVMGFRLPENFNQPYLAVGFTDFWQRWHISLSSWIRDYLYIPLGGNRMSAPRVFMNLWVCFLASGLWHGANWTFIVWGAYHGFFVWSDRFLLRSAWVRVPQTLRIAVTFALVAIGWIFFRAANVTDALELIEAAFDPTRRSTLVFLGPTNAVYLILTFGLIASFVSLSGINRLVNATPGAPLIRQISITGLAVWTFGSIYANTFTPFLYFRF